MTDEIHIRDLHLRTIIGVNQQERRERQDVVINVTLFADTRPAARSDSIEQAVDYRTVTKDVIELVEQSRFFLVETLAAQVAATCLQNPQVQRVRVNLEKPQAIRFARTAGVTIERSSDDREPTA